MSSGRTSDQRSSEDLVEVHRLERHDKDSHWEAMWILRDRGSRTEFEIGRRLTESKDPEDRAIGADLLAQLGSGNGAFQDESVSILIALLGDPDTEVIHSAAIGLGHRRAKQAVIPLVELADHEDPRVREAVVHGLLTQDDERAVSTLIRLSSDVDYDTRNWAMFGLGSMIETDTPALREALAAGLKDADSEIRGEALVGLARRRDPRALTAVKKELARNDVGTLALEAAKLLADPSLVPHLTDLLASPESDDSDYFRERLMEALAACESGQQPTEPPHPADGGPR